MGLPVINLFGNFNIVSFSIDFVAFYALYLAISLSLNLEFGFAGVPNFGKVLFIAGGAAVAGSLSGRLAAYVLNVPTHGDFITFNPTIIIAVDSILPSVPVFVVLMFVFALLIGGAIGALFGYLASFPAIRLREDYLGMLLLGVAQFWQIILLTYTPLTGGDQNIAVPNPYIYFTNLGTGYATLAEMVVVSVFAVAVFIYAERVARSPLGRTLKAVRESEDAARALGKDDAAFRRNILIVASAIAGVAGAIYAFQVSSVTYDTWTRFVWTFWPFLIVIIGGAGNNVGVAVGAFFFALVYKGLLQVQPYLQPYLPFDPNWLTYLLFASLLIGILMLRPEGLVKEKSAPTLPRRKLMSILGQAAPESAPSDERPRARKGIAWLRSLFDRRRQQT
ncbi:MAG: branched-chain amino acid ABC transporter permease [Thaumarchaeota archaeon]|nr:branched-chain amino acid ABC transporter permease [Nitrososphaerota archaeon]